MTKEEEAAKAAADQAAADAAAKAAADKDTGPSAEERKAADDKRVADEKATADKLAAADGKLATLEATIKKMREQQDADAKRGKDTRDLEARIDEQQRRLADSEKLVLDLHEDKKRLIEEGNETKLDVGLRKVLEGKVDSDSMDDAIDLLKSRKQVRVDADGKIAVLNEKGAWGSLTPESVLNHVSPKLQLAKGVPGGGHRGPGGEVKVENDSWKVSQAEFNRLSKEGKIPTGDGRNPVSN